VCSSCSVVWSECVVHALLSGLSVQLLLCILIVMKSFFFSGVSLDRSVTPTYIMTISNRSHFDRQAFELYIDKTFNLQLIAKTCMICASNSMQ
jgi:hypothetical protein